MRLSKKYIFFTMILLCVILSAILLKGVKYPITGDGREYILMSQGFINHGSPDLRDEDIRSAYDGFKKVEPNFNDIYINCKHEGNCPDDLFVNHFYFTSLNNSLYSWHFFAYSLVNVPMYYFFSKMNYEPTSSFIATNIIILSIALFSIIYVLKESVFYKSLIIISILNDTTFSYLKWNHPESFTASMCIISFVLLKNNRYKLSSIVMALAGLQNQPLGIVAGLIFIYGFIKSTGLNKKTFLNLLSDKRRVISILSCGLITIAIILTPSFFYYYHYGVPNIIIQHHASSRALISPHRLYELFFDFNQGMILSIPFQMLTLIIINLASIFFVIAAIPCLTTTNWNSDEANIFRYSYWLSIPIIFSFAESYSSLKDKKKITLAIFIIFSIIVAFCGRKIIFSRNYNEHSPVANFVMSNYPSLYNPEPEVFIERSFNKEGMFMNFFSTGNSLAYVHHGFITKELTIEGKSNNFPCNYSTKIYSPFVYYNYAEGCKLTNLDVNGAIALPLASVHKGSTVNFDSEVFNVSSGWSGSEVSYRWSDGDRSFLLFNVNGKEEVSSIDTITINGSTYGSIMASIQINGHTIFDGILVMNMEDRQFSIPAGVLHQGYNSLVFEWKNPRAPSKKDPRHISFALSKIIF
jgi:hypothetical protein